MVRKSKTEGAKVKRVGGNRCGEGDEKGDGERVKEGKKKKVRVKRREEEEDKKRERGWRKKRRGGEKKRERKKGEKYLVVP